MKIVLPERLKPVLSPLPSDPEIAWYTDTDSCIAAMPGAEVVWLHFGLTDIDRVFRAGTELKWVTSAATGVDGWPLDILRERHVVLTNGSGVGAIPISEYVVMGLLAGLKGLPAMVRAQDRREWLKGPPSMAELNGKRALVYGYGGIGRAIADRLRPFGVAVTGVRRQPGGEADVIAAEGWEARLPDTDLLILSVPLTGATTALVGRDQLAALAKGAWVANIARGGLIDQDALIAALKSGHLGGAYLDVTDPEPLPAESELWSLPNAIITPHTSWATEHLMERAAEIFVDNFNRYLRDEPLRNVVDMTAGY
ncbi:MAG TPA: D-2-hydroxyacid dehydrogenase [Candidatus Dormibacteraeota bacterium]|nr:D-2-hydroxyacid dehydrogenase [Candidatus Dormibacteraeota bacterium]